MFSSFNVQEKLMKNIYVKGSFKLGIDSIFVRLILFIAKTHKHLCKLAGISFASKIMLIFFDFS